MLKNIILILTGIIYFTGCYTVIEHPKLSVKDENGFSYTKDVAFYDDCGKCHTESEVKYYAAKSKVEPISTYHERDGFYAQRYYGAYNEYYNLPWWYTIPIERFRDDENYVPENSGRTSSNSDGGQVIYEGRNRDRNGDYDYPIPTYTSGSGSSTSSSTTSSSASSSTTSTRERVRTEDRNNNSDGTRQNSNSSENRQSSGSKSRNNDGGRSEKRR